MARKKTASQIYVLTIGCSHFALPPDAPLTTILDALQRAVQVDPNYDSAEHDDHIQTWKPDERPARVELELVPASKFRVPDLVDDPPARAACRPVGNGRDLVVARPRVNGRGTNRLFAE